MNQPRVIDVAALPKYGFGHRSLTWWGTVGLLLIESTAFGLAIASYLYLKGRADEWPTAAFAPRMFWANVTTGLLLLSAIPNEIVKRAAQKLSLRQVQFWLVMCLAIEVAAIGTRALEFPLLNVRWDANAYGSMVWTLIGLHTTHLITDCVDSVVLTVLMFAGPVNEHRFVDVAENSLYWYFVIASWMPIYAVIYLVPRFG
jgi:cytochrome c oxidase subunit III